MGKELLPSVGHLLHLLEELAGNGLRGRLDHPRADPCQRTAHIGVAPVLDEGRLSFVDELQIADAGDLTLWALSLNGHRVTLRLILIGDPDASLEGAADEG